MLSLFIFLVTIISKADSRCQDNAPPQSILVNNFELQAVSTDVSEKDVDFIAEYQYAVGDVVNVTCINFLKLAHLTMEYTMAGTVSDKSTMEKLSAHKAIGFVAKLHSRHNNSYMICTNEEPTNYTKVMVRFIMRTEFNMISVRINGMTVRPKLKNYVKNTRSYEIEYKYPNHKLITVECEVQRTDARLVVLELMHNDTCSTPNFYKNKELIPGKKAVMSFYLASTDERKKIRLFAANMTHKKAHKHKKKSNKFNNNNNNNFSNNNFFCGCAYLNGTIAEQVIFHFAAGNFPSYQYPLHMELPSNGTAMEFYIDDKLKVIYYEFNDGEILQLKCGPLLLPTGPGPVMYLQQDSDQFCKTDGCFLSKTLQVTGKDNNTAIVCHLKEQEFDPRTPDDDRVLQETRVILRERVLATASPVTASSEPSVLGYCMSALGSALFVLSLIILYWSAKKRYCCRRSSSQELAAVPASTSRPHSVTMYYENLLSVFGSLNEREAAELEMDNHYEEVQQSSVGRHTP